MIGTRVKTHKAWSQAAAWDSDFIETNAVLNIDRQHAQLWQQCGSCTLRPAILITDRLRPSSQPIDCGYA